MSSISSCEVEVEAEVEVVEDIVDVVVEDLENGFFRSQTVGDEYESVSRHTLEERMSELILMNLDEELGVLNVTPFFMFGSVFFFSIPDVFVGSAEHNI